MTQELRIAVVGDYDPTLRAHDATDQALQHAARAIDINVNIQWFPTPSVEGGSVARLQHYDAVWIAPGSPYRSMNGALNSIRFARENHKPLIGTCGGFQHVVIEYARNVMGFEDAQHAEYDPYASTLFISALACSLVGKTMEVRIDPNSRVADFYEELAVQEQYYCNFGINPVYRSSIHEKGLCIAGVDQDGEARILEIPAHPFFVATLFVPQLTSSWDKPHPLIVSYLRVALSLTERQTA